MPRLALLANHVLSSEPTATQRLRPHAGKCIRLHLRDAPTMLSWLPSALTVTVTAAGLLDWQPDADASADLVVSVDAANPAQSIADTLAGRKPPVEVSGDAAFATDLSWLIDHLRWDVHDDLARIVGDAAAVPLMRFGSAAASGLRHAVQTTARAVSDLRRTTTPSAPAEPPPR